jgi:hypothetical protein
VNPTLRTSTGLIVHVGDGYRSLVETQRVEGSFFKTTLSASKEQESKEPVVENIEIGYKPS